MKFRNYLKYVFLILLTATCMIIVGTVPIQAAAKVDWTHGVIVADYKNDGHNTGLNDVQQELRQAAESVMITETRTLKQYFNENLNLDRKFSYIIEEATFTELPDEQGIMHPVCQIQLYGVSRSIISLVLPDEMTEQPFIRIEKPKKSAVQNTETAETESKNDKKTKEYFTGLIVDCRGLDFQPLMLPTIKNETGQPIYSINNFDRAVILSRGLAAYAADEASAVKAGDNPLLVKPLTIEPGTIILSDTDANTVLGANMESSFLQGAKVVILI